MQTTIGNCQCRRGIHSQGLRQRRRLASRAQPPEPAAWAMIPGSVSYSSRTMQLKIDGGREEQEKRQDEKFSSIRVETSERLDAASSSPLPADLIDMYSCAGQGINHPVRSPCRPDGISNRIHRRTKMRSGVERSSSPGRNQRLTAQPEGRQSVDVIARRDWPAKHRGWTARWRRLSEPVKQPC